MLEFDRSFFGLECNYGGLEESILGLKGAWRVFRIRVDVELREVVFYKLKI